MCQELLCYIPDLSNILTLECLNAALETTFLNDTKMSCLNSALETPFLNATSDDVCRQRAYIHIMILLGGHLLSNESGNLVPLRLLSLLRDLETAEYYSWDSVVLVTLYHSMCDVTSLAT